MPAYKQKITRLTYYPEFCEKAHAVSDPLRRAFLEVLFYSGHRISEVLKLEAQDIDFSQAESMLYLNLWRLKKHTYKKGKKAGQSKNYKEITPIPMTPFLPVILTRTGRVFPWGYRTGYRIVKQAFPLLYPHYFRLNMRTIIGELEGDAAGRSLLGISPAADAAYVGQISLKRVGQAMKNHILQS